jgi:hypothetical protein
MPLAAGLALALSTVLSGTSAAAAVAPQTPPPAAQTVQQYIETQFADTPIMIAVARCESHFRQFDKDGSVHRGVVNNKDVGVMQINEHYHLDTAKKLGIDIYSVEGNVQYAKYLYDQEGTTPWNSSSPCWDKKVARK